MFKLLYYFCAKRFFWICKILFCLGFKHVCRKTPHPNLSNTWTVNFQMFKLVLEKTEEPEIKLPISAGSSNKQESSRKTSISALLTMTKPWTVWITINWKILKEMRIPDHLTCLLGGRYWSILEYWVQYLTVSG